jgi:hypothetical protein
LGDSQRRNRSTTQKNDRETPNQETVGFKLLLSRCQDDEGRGHTELGKAVPESDLELAF